MKPRRLANQLSLTFSSVAYSLLAALRRLGLAGTSLAHAQCATIRITLLKIEARIRITVRKVESRLQFDALLNTFVLT